MGTGWVAGPAVVPCLAPGRLPALALGQGAEFDAVAVAGTQACDFGCGSCTLTATNPRVAGAGTIANKDEASEPVEDAPNYIWDEVTLQGPRGRGAVTATSSATPRCSSC